MISRTFPARHSFSRAAHHPQQASLPLRRIIFRLHRRPDINEQKQFLVSGLVIAIVIVVLILMTSGISPNSATTSPQATTTATQPLNPTSYVSRQLPLQAEYSVNLPNGIMLVDSQGRRTGKDPAAGVKYHEIPGTAYGEDCLIQRRSKMKKCRQEREKQAKPGRDSDHEKPSKDRTIGA